MAFVGIVMMVSAIASVAASILYFVAGLLFLGIFDHLFGAFLGLVQGVIMIGVFMVAAITFFPEWTQAQSAHSLFAHYLVGFFTSISLVFAPAELRQIIEQALFRL